MKQKEMIQYLWSNIKNVNIVVNKSQWIINIWNRKQSIKAELWDQTKDYAKSIVKLSKCVFNNYCWN